MKKIEKLNYDTNVPMLEGFQDKLNQLIDTLTALQDDCMSGFKEADEPRILNCPFCGSLPELDYNGTGNYEVRCIDSQCRGFSNSLAYVSKSSAIKDWNKRA